VIALRAAGNGAYQGDSHSASFRDSDPQPDPGVDARVLR